MLVYGTASLMRHRDGAGWRRCADEFGQLLTRKRVMAKR